MAIFNSNEMKLNFKISVSKNKKNAKINVRKCATES